MTTDSASTSRAPGEEGPSSSSSSSSSPSDKKSKRPPESRFLQQQLPACKPLLTPGWVMSIYLLVGLIFIPIGVFALMASNSVVEIVERYDASCVPTWAKNEVQYIQNNSISKLCKRHIVVPKLMNPPIFVYYELNGFYQNHRRYVKSRSDGQLLHGSEATDTSSCKPELYLHNNANRTIVPCGLIAWSLFNDTYNFSADTKQIPVNKKGIAWKSDREHRFGDNVYPQNFPNNVNETGVLIGGGKLNTTEPLDEDEDLMVWMRTAALPNFRKLYGRIEQPLEANTTITIDINNVYNTYSFGGQKKVVLSTATWLGGKNDFLGIAYITIGSLCILLAMVFFVVHITHRRPLGDVNYLSWNRQRAD